MAHVSSFIVILAYLLQFSVCFQPWGGIDHRRTANRRNLNLLNVQDGDGDGDIDADADGEDWRAFRARLVMNVTDASKPSSSSSFTSSWAYDAGLMVEKGSIVLSRVESSLGCHDLRQPYFCKSVVLIVDHDEEFTQGIILNRPSNLRLYDNDIVYLDDEGSLLLEEEEEEKGKKYRSTPNNEKQNSWRMYFGGDIAGLYDESPLILCLHNCTSSELAQSVSETILPGVHLTSHLSARALVESGEASPDSFYTFYGFCGWDPGMLEKEVERGSWNIVSTDPKSLWSELTTLRDASYDPRSAGLTMWEDVMTKLGRDDEVGTRDAFPDLMLREWASEMLVVPSKDGEDDGNDGDTVASDLDDSDIYRALKAADRPPVQAGTLLRGSSLEVSPFLLQDQFLHKSSIVVLQDTVSFSVGLILNLPTTDSYSIALSDGTFANFTIRYGGHSGNNNDNAENDDNDDPLVWLHCCMGLKYLRIGKPLVLGNDNGVWTCTLDQVKEAIELGFAGGPEDFLLVQGFCVWEKEADGSAGGVLGQIMSGKLDVVSSDAVDDIWNTLLQQDRLSEETLEVNQQLARKAWNRGGVFKSDNSRFVFDTHIKVSTLAENALQSWIKIYLLGNTEYYGNS